ncbi:hypothetical protein RJT34_06396 [Clitoria ternatea]|uniref:Uncharacterized protein n=1 Tax=Clitoria ternatea TaxID=43366 RepID=A0AAN9K1P8_CLITE
MAQSELLFSHSSFVLLSSFITDWFSSKHRPPSTLTPSIFSQGQHRINRTPATINSTPLHTVQQLHCLLSKPTYTPQLQTSDHSTPSSIQNTVPFPLPFRSNITPAPTPFSIPSNIHFTPPKLFSPTNTVQHSANHPPASFHSDFGEK